MKHKKKPISYTQRTYREVGGAGLVDSIVKIQETDLLIRSEIPVVSQAKQYIQECRNQIENYIQSHPHFLTSLVPLSKSCVAPPLIQKMHDSASAAGVGPMAAVAGAVSE